MFDVRLMFGYVGCSSNCAEGARSRSTRPGIEVIDVTAIDVTEIEVIEVDVIVIVA